MCGRSRKCAAFREGGVAHAGASNSGAWRSDLRIFSVAVCAFMAAEAVAQLALYERLFVPMLASVRRVPVYWWLGVMSPYLLAGIGVASVVSSRRSLIAAAVGGGLGCHALRTVWACSGRPGHLKSLAVEGPWMWWTSSALLAVVGTAVLVAMGCGAVWLGRRIRASR